MNSSFLCLGSFGCWPVVISCENFFDESPDYIDRQFRDFVNSAEFLKSDVLIIRFDSSPGSSSSFSSVVRVDSEGRVSRL